MTDLTVLYYTANTLKEPFATKLREVLWEAKKNHHLISISQKPMNFGQNIVVDYPRSYLSIYKQILVGAKNATTDYVALAEDDCLYPKEHFDLRPKLDEFGYDMARWSIYSWSNPPIYSIKYRISNSTLIAPRKLLIESLEERFRKFPDESQIPLGRFSEPGKYEKQLGVTERKATQYFAKCASVVFSHPEAIGFDYLGTRKKLGELQAYDIPYWGRADDLIKKFYL